MIKFNCTTIELLRSLSRSTIIILMLIPLFACSGGIFGTGDGDDDIIVVEPDSTANHGNTTDGQIATQLPIPQIFPPQFVLPVSYGLVTRYPEDNRFPTKPVIHSISEKFSNLSRINILIQVDIDQLENQLLDSINQCSSPCQLIERTVTTTISQNTLDYQTSLQPQPESTATTAAGDQTTFSDVSFTNGLSGYYDESLAYTRSDGTEIFITWSNDRQLISTRANNSSEAVYILTDFENSIMHVRSENKLDTTLIQAVVINDTDSNTSLEADWQGAKEHYVRATASANAITLYSLNPVDPSAPRFREFISIPQLNYSIESCITANNICGNWTSLINDDIDSTDRFSETQDTIGEFSTTLTSSLQPTLPANVNEYVISSDINSTQPSPMSLLCGGQRVAGNLRTFCWQPLPLENPTAIFEESFTSSGRLYQRIPGASF